MAAQKKSAAEALEAVKSGLQSQLNRPTPMPRQPHSRQIDARQPGRGQRGTMPRSPPARSAPTPWEAGTSGTRSPAARGDLALRYRVHPVVATGHQGSTSPQ